MPRILVIEDNLENSDALSRRLQRRGFEVIAAEDGVVGVNMAKSERPNLILMDMNMPEMDGWEATRQIRLIPDLTTLPIIALTAHAMQGDRQRLDAGCTDYHTKPVDFPKLLQQIEALLQQRSSGSTSTT